MSFMSRESNHNLFQIFPITLHYLQFGEMNFSPTHKLRNLAFVFWISINKFVKGIGSGQKWTKAPNLWQKNTCMWWISPIRKCVTTFFLWGTITKSFVVHFLPVQDHAKIWNISQEDIGFNGNKVLSLQSISINYIK